MINLYREGELTDDSSSDDMVNSDFFYENANFSRKNTYPNLYGEMTNLLSDKFDFVTDIVQTEERYLLIFGRWWH